MKLVKTLAVVAALAPLSLALASNPTTCIEPGQLYQKASANTIYDVEAAVKDHTLKTDRWYSVGKGNYTTTMTELLNSNNQWENGPLGYENSNGVFCDYYDKATDTYVDLQKFYKLPKTISNNRRGDLA